MPTMPSLSDWSGMVILRRPAFPRARMASSIAMNSAHLSPSQGGAAMLARGP